MIISIDFDQTYSADPDMWDTVIRTMLGAGHTVYCVTCRPEWDTANINSIVERIGIDNIFFTDNVPKIEYMQQLGYHVDIWIDDCPATVTGGGKVMWRKSKKDKKL